MDGNISNESVWKRGWEDTKSTWTSWPFVVADAIIGVIGGSLTAWYWGLAIVGFGMICAWIVATVRAPIFQRDEARVRLRELEEERIPRITASPFAGRRQWDWQHEHLMWAELQVANTSPSLTLNDVEVRVVSRVHVLEKQDAQGNYMLYDPQDWNSVNVYWSERNAPPDQLRLTIPPNTTRIALIAFSDDSNGPPAVFNAPIHKRPLLFSGGAKIEVEVSSTNSTPWRGAFYIECHPNYLGGARATFEFIEWETWLTNHTIVPLA